MPLEAFRKMSLEPHLGHILSEHSEFIDECMSCQGTSEGAFTKGMCVKDGV